MHNTYIMKHFLTYWEYCNNLISLIREKNGIWKKIEKLILHYYTKVSN